MADVVVPVGLSLGQDFANAAEGAQVPWQVRYGADIVELDADDALAWSAAASDPVRYLDEECGRTAFESVLPRNGRDVVCDLLARGLLVEYDRDDGPWQPVFERVRLLPLGYGFGNSADSLAEYQVGVSDEASVALGANPYLLWSYSFTSTRSLWEACGTLARAADAQTRPGEPGSGLGVDDVAREMAAALPLLVASGCAFLDPVQPVEAR